MSIDQASSSSPSVTPTGAASARNLRDRLWAQVLAAFPKTRASSVRLEEGGGDHLLLIVDEERAYRFPRAGGHSLTIEIEVLRQLRPKVRIMVPAYDVVDPAGCFASYLMVPGVPLTPRRYARFPTGDQREVVGEAAELLNVLHRVDAQAIAPIAAWPRTWPASEFADRIEDLRLSTIAHRAPELADAITRFLRRYRQDRAPGAVVVHGDLVPDHLMIVERTRHLNGIIDFGDVSLGDPAHDFLGFWAYGPEVAAWAVGQYSPAGSDPGLLARSHNHFIRYRIDRLFEVIADGQDAASVERRARTLSAQLGRLLSASMRTDGASTIG